MEQLDNSFVYGRLRHMQNCGIGIIYCVKRDEDGTIAVLGLQGLFDKDGKCVPRSEVVRQVESGAHIYTLFRPKPEASYEIGPQVHVFPMNGKRYLRTDRDEIAEDNLAQLEECEACGC